MNENIATSILWMMMINTFMEILQNIIKKTGSNCVFMDF